MITSLLGCTPDPHSRNFDPHVRCAYHSDIQDHSIEGCSALKREIEMMIQEKMIVVENIDTTKVTQNPSPTHDNAQYVGRNESWGSKTYLSKEMCRIAVKDLVMIMSKSVTKMSRSAVGKSLISLFGRIIGAKFASLNSATYGKENSWEFTLVQDPS
ncbi:hypothetical protein BC332_01619 [Capsicum chinense]|nr:hypothetical protein BC332_01619 [Capsicum chinense]